MQFYYNYQYHNMSNNQYEFIIMKLLKFYNEIYIIKLIYSKKKITTLI